MNPMIFAFNDGHAQPPAGLQNVPWDVLGKLITSRQQKRKHAAVIHASLHRIIQSRFLGPPW